MELKQLQISLEYAQIPGFASNFDYEYYIYTHMYLYVRIHIYAIYICTRAHAHVMIRAINRNKYIIAQCVAELGDRYGRGLVTVDSV